MNRCCACGALWDTGADCCPSCQSRRIQRDHVPSPFADQIRAAVLGYLRPLEKPLADELGQIASAELDEETHLIDFEVHSSEFPRGFPVRWDAMDSGVGQLDDGGGLLEGSGGVIPEEFFRTPEYKGVDLPDFCFRVLVDWFADCWERAGGHGCAYPAYISHHDSGVAFDLRQRRWVRDNERYPPD